MTTIEFPESFPDSSEIAWIDDVDPVLLMCACPPEAVRPGHDGRECLNCHKPNLAAMLAWRPDPYWQSRLDRLT